MTAFEIYLIMQMDAFSGFTTFIGLVVSVIGAISYGCGYVDDNDESRKHGLAFLVPGFIVLSIGIALPSSKTLAAMYVIPPLTSPQAIEALRNALKAIEATPAQTPCAACNNFQDGMCLHWKALVPEEHLGRGCAEFEELIPF